jgi:hypothetical protein
MSVPGYAQGQARSGRDGAGPLSGQIGPPRFPATTPEVSGPPNPDPSAVSPVPLPVPAGSSCVSAGTSREDCGDRSRRHRLSSVPPVTGRGDLRHTAGFR